MVTVPPFANPAFGDISAFAPPKLWPFMNRPENVTKMETASDLGRPAVEAIGSALLDEFGDALLDDRVKQLIGAMAKQVLERSGYVIDQQNVKISEPPFARGTRYRRADEGRHHVFRAASDPDERAVTNTKSVAALLPPPDCGGSWVYFRPFSNSLQATVALGVPNWKQALRDLARDGYHRYRYTRILKAGR